MNKPLGIAVLVAGIVLLIYGFHAADSMASGFSKLFSGAPTDKSIFLLIAGAILTAFGATTVIRNR
jgi:hypothetical protein